MRTGLMLLGGICSFKVLISTGGRNVSGFWSVDAYSFVYSCRVGISSNAYMQLHLS